MPQQRCSGSQHRLLDLLSRLSHGVRDINNGQGLQPIRPAFTDNSDRTLTPIQPMHYFFQLLGYFAPDARLYIVHYRVLFFDNSRA